MDNSYYHTDHFIINKGFYYNFNYKNIILHMGYPQYQSVHHYFGFNLKGSNVNLEQIVFQTLDHFND